MRGTVQTKEVKAGLYPLYVGATVLDLLQYSSVSPHQQCGAEDKPPEAKRLANTRWSDSCLCGYPFTVCTQIETTPYSTVMIINS